MDDSVKVLQVHLENLKQPLLDLSGAISGHIQGTVNWWLIMIIELQSGV